MKESEERYFEFILTNGKRVLVCLEVGKMYNITEEKRMICEINSKFPFIHISKKPYVQFRHMDIYETMTSSGDSKFKVDCSMECFKEMIGCDCRSFEEELIRSVTVNGK